MYGDYLSTRERYLEHYGIPGMKWRFTKYTNKIHRNGKDVYEYLRNTGNSAMNRAKFNGRVAQAKAGIQNVYNKFTGGNGIGGRFNRKMNQMKFKAGTALVKSYGQKALKFAKGVGMGAKRIVNNVLRNLRNRRAVNQTADTLEQLRKKHTVSGRAQAYKEYSDKLSAYNNIYGTGSRPKNYNQRMFQESGGYNPLNRRKSKVPKAEPVIKAVPQPRRASDTPKNYNQRMFQESGGYNPLNRRKSKTNSGRKTNTYSQSDYSKHYKYKRNRGAGNPYWGRK